MGFSVPPRLRLERWALTPPFHPYRRLLRSAGGSFSVALSVGTPFGVPPACILPSLLASAPQVTRHRALWCSDFPPPPARAGESDSPPFQNRPQYKGWPGRLQAWRGMRVRLTVTVIFGPRRRSAISNLQFTIGNFQFPAWSKGHASRDCSRSAGILVRRTVLTQLGRCCGQECPRSGGSVEIRPSKGAFASHW